MAVMLDSQSREAFQPYYKHALGRQVCRVLYFRNGHRRVYLFFGIVRHRAIVGRLNQSRKILADA